MSADRPNFIRPVIETAIAGAVTFSGAGAVSAQSPTSSPDALPSTTPIVETSPLPVQLDCVDPVITVAAVDQPAPSSPYPNPSAEPTPAGIAQGGLTDTNTQGGDSSVGGETSAEEDPYVKYSIESLIEKGFQPMEKAEFMGLIDRCAPKILEFSRSYPDQDTIEELHKLFEESVDLLIADGHVKNDGVGLMLDNIVLHVSIARMYIPKDRTVSDAFFAVADAERRVLQEYAELDAKGKAKKDKQVDKLIEEKA